ncbi:hypothetical protein FIBSPDRAFT_956495 [Athelia psychrophila]|uniref:Uncharacterized protein n=1 Tax=Athelia psychrophila TaxID=1759441 RepID=A0A166GSE4_9AGAM|nr:hypothetical protein FIBSPDRAFT_956495 [Fibularhizoctonia sp. CBS 109695]
MTNPAAQRAAAPAPSDEERVPTPPVVSNDKGEEAELPPHFPSIEKCHHDDDLTVPSNECMSYLAPRAMLPEGTYSSDYSTTSIAGLTGWAEAKKKLRTKTRFLQALRLGQAFRISELPEDRGATKLTRSELLKPLIRRALDILDALCLTFSVLYGTDGIIMCAAPRAEQMAALNLQIQIIKELQEATMKEKGLEEFGKISWGEENDYTQWRTLNNFEILITNYRYDVECLLLHYAPYCPSKREQDEQAGVETSQPTISTIPATPATPVKPRYEPTSVSEHPYRHQTTPVSGTVMYHLLSL